MAGEADEYVLARRVLLDALETLGVHRGSMVLVGAQALYLHTGDVESTVAPYTTDADLAVNPETIADAPLLAAVMASGGFVAAAEPGTWMKDAVQVDLMVPEALAGSGRRGAKLGVHGNKVTRKARGLEGALVDNEVMTISALAGDDPRSFEVAVASPAALLSRRFTRSKIGLHRRTALRTRTRWTFIDCCLPWTQGRSCSGCESSGATPCPGMSPSLPCPGCSNCLVLPQAPARFSPHVRRALSWILIH